MDWTKIDFKTIMKADSENIEFVLRRGEKLKNEDPSTLKSIKIHEKSMKKFGVFQIAFGITFLLSFDCFVDPSWQSNRAP